jgi:DNA-binding CsgD family transcriptional regulator
MNERFPEWCRQLFAAAINDGQYGNTWAALAEHLHACRVQLLRDISIDDTTAGGVQPFDVDVRHPVLARALSAAGAQHGLCACIRPADHGTDVLIVLRTETPFTEAERSWIELLTTHIHAALDLRDQLASPLPTAASVALLAKLFPTPCLLTDDAGRCIERNEAFDQVLPTLAGSLRAGRVVFQDPFLQDSWAQALQEGRATAVAQSLLATTRNGIRWKMHLVPFACVGSLAERSPRHLTFALFERFAAAPTQTLTVPSSRPLTKAELEVLASLLLGQTAKVIARTRGASVNTVRSQITAILAKTGQHTQKELIASFSASAFESLVPRYEAGDSQ